MSVAVIADLVPGRMDGARHPRQALRIHTDLEEGRWYLIVVEKF